MIKIVDITKHWKEPNCRLCDRAIYESKAVDVVIGGTEYGRDVHFYYHIKCVKELVKDAV